MLPPSGETTRLTLLERVRDRSDHAAWAEFVAIYDRLLRRWCRHYRLGAEAADELCQRTWIKVFPLMEEFQYDPGRGFRRWLWRVFESRAMEVLGERTFVRLPRGDAWPGAELDSNRLDLDDIGFDGADVEARPERLILLRHAEEAQAAVRARVDPNTWASFWQTMIEDRPVSEVAHSMGKSYAAVYYGSQRVSRMLRREGERRLGRPGAEARD
jgi:RNA polymerase sigma-70 factor, ECF subfamily